MHANIVFPLAKSLKSLLSAGDEENMKYDFFLPCGNFRSYNDDSGPHPPLLNFSLRPNPSPPSTTANADCVQQEGKYMNQQYRQRRVLVVDANREAAENLQGMLSINGFTALATSDLTRCTRQVADFSPDVILVEASRLTEMDLQVPDQLRESRRVIHIIAMTPFHDRLSLYALAQAGFDEMIDPGSGIEQIMLCCQ